MSKFIKFSAIAASVTLVVACGGGGGGTSEALKTSYQAAISIGDSGSLVIDRTSIPITYSLEIANSSYGLTGRKISGQLQDSGSGLYKIAGSTHGQMISYDCYSIVPVNLNQVNVGNVYVPVVALKNSCLKKTVDQITSDGAVREYRAIRFSYKTINGNKTYLSEALRGVITKTSSTSYTVRTCSNLGRSENNANLTDNVCLTASDTAPFVRNRIFNYDSSFLNADGSKGAWVEQGTGNVKSIANFVSDTEASKVFGYVDISDETGATAGFEVVSVANSSLTDENSSLVGKTFSGTSYQLCASLSNCAISDGERGIYLIRNMMISSGSETSITGRGCSVTNADDNPVLGFSSNVHSATSSYACNQSRDRPDTISFSFGSTTVNGKKRIAAISAGYDSTTTDGYKISFIIGTED